MNFRKLISLICVANVFSFALLTGCGKADNSLSSNYYNNDVSISSSSNISKSSSESSSDNSSDNSSSTYENNSSSSNSKSNNSSSKNSIKKSITINLSDIPNFSGKPYVEINNNQPDFDFQNLTTNSYEYYSDLDSLGRCGVCYACIGKELMPTEKRGSIGSVKPSGWHTVKYDDVDGKYLYNRCHLIGYQLTGENANTKNLITGTRYLNINGMLPFEDMVADYIKETGNHIMYRVTPVFDGDNLVASGVQIEAYSVEDDGDGICFNVYCYNNQPNITIDYATGDSRHNNDTVAENKEETKEEVTEENNRVDEPAQSQVESVYILNTNTKKIHLPTCSSVKKIKEENKEEYTGNINDLLSNGYSACKKCNP